MVRHVGISAPYRSQLRLPSSILKLFYPDAGPSPKYGSRRTWSENSLKPRPFKLTLSSRLVRGVVCLIHNYDRSMNVLFRRYHGSGD